MEFEMSRKQIVCQDGFSMLVQAGAGHYCHPRITGLGFYDEYEVRFPSQAEPLLRPFAVTGTVYGYVPVAVIEQVIAKHGGVVGTEEGEKA